MQELGLDKTMQVSFDFTEQTEIVKREKRKPLEARQDWQRSQHFFVLTLRAIRLPFCGTE